MNDAPEDTAVDAQRPRRHVRTFVRRAGRTTERQQRALEALWPAHGIDLPDPAPAGYWDGAFAMTGPLTLEIGFGMGQSLLEMARREPGRRFVGTEVHPPGVGALLAGIEELGLANLKVLDRDVLEILESAFGPGELDRVQIFFPDPWPKKRHHKRRLVQANFVERLATRVAPGGELMLATDWEPYAQWMLEVLDASNDWENLHGPGAFAPDPGPRTPTRFEARGLRHGHVIRDLRYR
ncbi:MAG: tRNA (guanosine(46)-N7)-methyltransferase TrmB, partial [Pseudomonadales bacterium]|nr:tRNA (guanosine(46)-N7)-methyltransferase TrmB [Pseudomonadales bacterium]